MSHLQEIGKYKIIKHLGSGHFGNVYLAHDRALDAYKAIKVLDVDNPERFLEQLEEAQILNKCRHKHIVEVNEADVYDVNGVPKVLIDMEFIPDGSLENHLEDNFISVVEATNYIIHILFGLEHAHNQNILHRDIKPANIMLSGSIAKLSDFGLATFVGSGAAGSPKGYIPHLAPEVFGNDCTTFATDIYAVGITFFRLVSNITDWSDTLDYLPNAYEKIKVGNLVKSIGYPPYIPQKIKRIINKACHPDPAKRYRDAQEMRQALEALTPSINWKMQNPDHWIGESWRTQDKYAIRLIAKKGYEVVVKKNGRKVTTLCKSLARRESAEKYMMKHVCETTFE